jgi:membrane-associated protein
MHYRTFVSYNVLGGFLWAVGITSLGYILGETVPSIDKYLLPAIAVIIGLSALPVLFEIRKARRESAAAAATPMPAPVLGPDVPVDTER